MSKTIKIDEVVLPPPNPKKEEGSSNSHREKNRSSSADYTTGQAPREDASSTSEENPFSSMASTAGLGWKTRFSLKLASWFFLLKNTKYGKWLIFFAILLGIILIVPLIALWLTWMLIKLITQIILVSFTRHSYPPPSSESEIIKKNKDSF